MAQKARVLLVNPSGRRLIKQLSETFPDYLWVLTLMNDKEICVGLKDGTPIVYGVDYDMIVANIR